MKIIGNEYLNRLLKLQIIIVLDNSLSLGIWYISNIDEGISFEQN